MSDIFTKTKHLFVLLTLCLLLLPARAGAQNDAITWEIEPAYEVVKAGAWMPLTITIANDGPDVTGTLRVRPSANANAVYNQPIDLPHGANKRIVMPVASSQETFGNSFYNVQLLNGDTVVKQQRIDVRHVSIDDIVIGVVSEDSAALPELADVSRNGVQSSLVRMTAAELPDRAEYLQPFEALFVHAADTSQLNEAQREALRLWVIDGGKLIVGGDQQMADDLADLLPAAVSGDGGTSSVTALEAATGWQARDRTFSAPIVRLEPKPGTDVGRGDNNSPILVRHSIGSGSVVQTAFDLKTLAEAGNIADLWQQILFLSWQQPAFATLSQNWWSLQNVLRLPSLALPSVFALLLFLVLYILAVGPINYLVLRRMGRREWAYVSVPLLVLIFSGGAYAWGSMGRGGNTITNQLSFVRVLPDTPRGQATSYLLFFSPARRTYDLSVPANTLLTNGEPPWQQQGSALEVTDGVDRTSISDLLIDVGGVRTVLANTVVDAPLVEATVRSIDGGQQIVVRNRSDQPIEDLGLVRGDGRSQTIGALAAGEERTLDIDLRPGSLDQIRTSSNGVIQRDAVLRDLASAFIVWGPDAGMNGVFFNGGAAVPERIVPAMPSVEMEAGSINTQEVASQRLYLIGWQQRAPIDVQLDGASSNSSGETLYFWHVQEEE